MASLAFETQIIEHDMNMLYILYLKQFFLFGITKS